MLRKPTNIISDGREAGDMQVPYHIFLFGTVVLCAMVPTLRAAEVAVESDQLVVKGFDDSIGLGAFSIVLGYDPAKTTVTEVAFIEPFNGATNIQPDKKTVRVSGFTVQPQLTGYIPVARIVYEGEDLFDVYVKTFVNAQGDTVATANPTYGEETSASPGTKPTAQPTGTAWAPPATSQPDTPQTTGTVPAGSVDTPAQPQRQQIETPESLGDTKPAVMEAGSSGSPTKTPAARSPMPPALGIFAFAITLFVLRREL